MNEGVAQAVIAEYLQTLGVAVDATRITGDAVQLAFDDGDLLSIENTERSLKLLLVTPLEFEEQRQLMAALKISDYLTPTAFPMQVHCLQNNLVFVVTMAGSEISVISLDQAINALRQAARSVNQGN